MKKFGFGLMRLPQANGVIDVEQVKEMVDLFLQAGGTYFDTAWAYNGSEAAIRQALVERYPRDSFLLADKCAAWLNSKDRDDAIAQFNTSLELTGAGYFDYYLLHNLGESRTQYFDDYGLWDWIHQLKADGKIRNFGFSFHATPEELEDILSKHPDVDFVQLQINYADWENSAVQSRRCYEIVRKYNKPIIVMEPIKGGTLANPPQVVADLFRAAEPEMSVASWALRYAADLDGVMMVLSGMSSVEQMKDNLSYMMDFDHFTEEERKVVAAAQEELSKIPLIPCTTCNYCAKVCPKDIGISGSLNAMNILTLYNNKAFAQQQEHILVVRHGRVSASECIQCGMCETVCPQHIQIRQELQRVREQLL